MDSDPAAVGGLSPALPKDWVTQRHARMAADPASVRSNEVALRSQEQFESYLLALTFTLLAAAVQTAKSGRVLTGDLLEWFGWFALFFSGLAGLWRFERRAAFYQALSNQQTQEENLLPAQVMAQRDPMATDPNTGERYRLADNIAVSATNIANYKKATGRLQKWMSDWGSFN